MILDACTLAGRWPFAPLRYERVEDLLRLMNRAQVGQALVSPLEGAFYQDPGPANATVAAQVAAHADRLLLAPAVNPAWPGWERELEHSRELGARAVRLFPNYHGYTLDGGEADRLAEAAGNGLVVIVTVRLQDERHHPPAFMVPAVPARAVAGLATRHPGTRFLLSMGRYAEIAEALGQAGANLWADLAGVQGPHGCFDRLADEVGAGRLVFGSEMLLQYPEPAVMKLRLAQQREALGRAGRALLNLGD